MAIFPYLREVSLAIIFAPSLNVQDRRVTPRKIMRQIPKTQIIPIYYLKTKTLSNRHNRTTTSSLFICI